MRDQQLLLEVQAEKARAAETRRKGTGLATNRPDDDPRQRNTDEDAIDQELHRYRRPVDGRVDPRCTESIEQAPRHAQKAHADESQRRSKPSSSRIGDGSGVFRPSDQLRSESLAGDLGEVVERDLYEHMDAAN